MSQRKLPGRGMDRKSSFARSFFQAEASCGGEEIQLDDSVPVPRSRPLGRLASRRNLQIKRPSMAPSMAAAAAVAAGAPLQRGVEATKSGDSLASAAASLASTGRGSFTSPPVAVAAAPPRNAEENWLRQSMLRNSGGGSAGAASAPGGFDMNAISAAADAVRDEDALDAGFDDEEVLEQYRIMAQHEATLRVKANTGFDVTEYEKRRKDPSAGGKDAKDKKGLYGGGKKPKLGLPAPQPVLSPSGGSQSSSGLSSPPILPLSVTASSCQSANYRQFLEDQQRRAEVLPEMSKGEVVRNTQMVDGEHVVRCWGCRVNLRVNYIATLVQCPECQTVSQARKRS